MTTDADPRIIIGSDRDHQRLPCRGGSHPGMTHGGSHLASYVEGSDIEEAVHDERRVQDAVLALMHLNAHKDKFGWRAWKTFPWEATDGLHERRLISDPRSKAKSVALTDEGARLAEQLFVELFGVEDAGSG